MSTFGRAMTADELAASALKKQQELEAEIKRLQSALWHVRAITYTAHLHSPRESLSEIQRLVDQTIGRAKA